MTTKNANLASRLTIAGTLLFGGLGYMALATPPHVAANPEKGAVSASSSEKAIQNLEQSGQAFSAIAKRLTPAVVSLKVEKKSGPDVLGSAPDDSSNPLNDELMKRFFGDRIPEGLRQRQLPGPKNPVVGQGSGFVVSPEGFILTNHHVVGDASKVTVRFHDGREMLAKVIGSDPQSDVAVIKVDGKNLPTLPLGDSSTTEVGEWVLASGAPFGLTHTLTAGIVSAVGRNSVGINNYENFIQTDAAINPGNSGGPLVNLRGEAIGINTAIFSRSGGSVGLGFAIPIDMAKQVYEQIRDHGTVVRGYMGVRIQALNQDLAEQFGLDDPHGVLIGDVQKGAPGEKAGLKQADVIVELDGKVVQEAASFRNSIAMRAPGSQVNLTVLRDGQRITVPVTLDKLPESATIASVKETQKSANPWGFSVQPLTSDLAKKFGYSEDSGVVITEVTPGSAASDAGLEPGMLIQQINRKKVQSAEEFNEILSNEKDAKSMLLLVSDGKNSRFVVLKTEN
ncbi:DegQ family serine endoprotease [Schlesneria sp. T3-172]|uniref:DegQ family serine endoprotease n=1 Tax=Schlesneria sphaerica TaxID=3373610 RepID=UPI0037CB7ADC